VRDIEPMEVLIVEDEPKMAELLRRGLGDGGIRTDIAGSGEDALQMGRERSYDAVVLDVMLPGMDGFATCARMRELGVDAPVLMLTARGAVEDRVGGLDSGADDYLTKPFSFAELLARLRALVRRGQSVSPDMLEVGELRLDLGARRVWRDTTEIALAARELALLEAFMRAPGLVLSRVELLERAWHDDFPHRSNVVDVYVRYLREKIDRPFGVSSLETVRGAGYRLNKDGGL
jgi:two-component system OmpR family response regulator